MRYDPGAYDIARLINLAACTFDGVAQVFGEGKRYGCLALAAQPDLKFRFPTIVVPFGEMPDTTRSFEFAPEKANRVITHPEHISSFQSKDRDLNQYPGGIRLQKEMSPFVGAIAWSSWSSMLDEAFSCGLAEGARLSTPSFSQEIVALSGNEFYPKIVDYIPFS